MILIGTFLNLTNTIMKFHNKNIIKIWLIIWLIIWLTLAILYIKDNASDKVEQNWFVKQNNIELNSLDISDE